MLDRILEGYEDKVVLATQRNGRQVFCDVLSESIVGQDKAKEAIADQLFTSLTSLMPKKGPIGTFLFCGPSGTGKTEMVRSIAKILLGKSDRFTKINCESLSESHAGASLFGSPPGYVGYDKGAMLGDHIYDHYNHANKEGSVSAMVRRFPDFNIILFDEIEKAHPKVHQSLLSIMDDGILKMANGDELDLSTSLIIMTSNVGEREIREIDSKPKFGFVHDSGTADKEKLFKDSLKLFSPEFLGRVNKVVRFDSLTKEDCNKILEIRVNDLNSYLHQISDVDHTTRLKVKLMPKVYDFLLEKGYKKEVGARDLERVFQKYVNGGLGEMLTANQELLNFPNHEVTVYVEMYKGEVRFSICKKGIAEIQRETVRLCDFTLRH